MAQEDAGNAAQGNSGQPDKQVGVKRIYLKDCSFEAPNTPGVFDTKWEPHVNLNVGASNTRIDDETYEVVLTVTAEATNAEKNAFLCEVKQAGVFMLRGLTQQELHQVLGSFCPNQLFPYAREVVADLVGKGGFPQLMLQPINFDALLAQHARQTAQASAEAAANPERH